ncbi:MAG: PEP-CTERM sorting domain-containing protein [Pseudomonadota bacterium]
MRIRALLPLIAGATLCWTGVASASPIVFDLTRSVSGNDNVASVTLVDSSTLSVNIDAEPGIREVDWDEQGMGVQGLFEFDDQLDGFGRDESLIFSFSESVRLLSATFSRVGSNDDFRLITGGGVIVDGDPGLQNPFDFISFDLVDSLFEFTVIGANDDYKISEIVVARIPEPGVLALFAVGLIGGLATRRRTAH